MSATTAQPPTATQSGIVALLPIMAVVLVAFLVIGLALPVLPLHVHQGLGLGAFVVGLVAGTQLAASFVSRLWSGHYADSRGAKRAVVAGVRSIEHGIFLDDEAIDLMRAAGAWLVPTLHASQSLLRAIDAGTPFPQAVVEKARLVVTAHQQSIARAHSAGVKIAMGTDCGVGPHGTNLDELDLMTRIGMAPVEALQAATGSAAELVGADSDLGRLAPGMRADLVVIDGSPTDLVGLPSRIRQVYLDGVLADRG